MAGHDHVEVTKKIIDSSPPLSEACAIQRIVIVQAHRHEFGVLRDRPDASLLLRARWIAQTRRRSALQMTRRNSMAHLSKKQRQERLMEEFLRRIREASPGERVYMAVGDLFEAAEVHDLNEVRTARRAAVDPAVAMRGRTAVEFWSETLRALKLATSVVAVTVAMRGRRRSGLLSHII